MTLGPRPKPPAETKAQLMLDIQYQLATIYPGRPFSAIEYLLNFFTAIDLQGIRQDLEKRTLERRK